MLIGLQIMAPNRSLAIGSSKPACITPSTLAFSKLRLNSGLSCLRNPSAGSNIRHFGHPTQAASTSGSDTDLDAAEGIGMMASFANGDEFTRVWAFGAELRHIRRIAETYKAHPGGVPPLVLAEHIAFVVMKDMTGLMRLGPTSHTPTVLLHELLLARGIESKLVKGYTIVKGRSGLSCMPSIWVEACGQQFEMVGRVADDITHYMSSKDAQGHPPTSTGHSVLNVLERPLSVPLATEVKPTPALIKESRDIEHLWEAMERVESEEHKIATYWLYSGLMANPAVMRYRQIMMHRFGNHDNWVRFAQDLLGAPPKGQE